MLDTNKTNINKKGITKRISETVEKSTRPKHKAAMEGSDEIIGYELED